MANAHQQDPAELERLLDQQWAALQDEDSTDFDVGVGRNSAKASSGGAHYGEDSLSFDETSAASNYYDQEQSPGVDSLRADQLNETPKQNVKQQQQQRSSDNNTGPSLTQALEASRAPLQASISLNSNSLASSHGSSSGSKTPEPRSPPLTSTPYAPSIGQRTLAATASASASGIEQPRYQTSTRSRQSVSSAEQSSRSSAWGSAKEAPEPSQRSLAGPSFGPGADKSPPKRAHALSKVTTFESSLESAASAPSRQSGSALGASAKSSLKNEQQERDADESAADASADMSGASEAEATGTMHTSDIAAPSPSAFDAAHTRHSRSTNPDTEQHGRSTPTQNDAKADEVEQEATPRSAASSQRPAVAMSNRASASLVNAVKRNSSSSAQAAAAPLAVSSDSKRSVASAASSSSKPAGTEERWRPPPPTPFRALRGGTTADSSIAVERALGDATPGLPNDMSSHNTPFAAISVRAEVAGEASHETSAGTSVDLGTASPAAGRFARQQAQRAATSSPNATAAGASASTSAAEVDQATAATPRAPRAGPDAERMKAYLLNSVKANTARGAVLRKLTPRPSLPLGMQTPGAESAAESSAMSSPGARGADRLARNKPQSSLALLLARGLDEVASPAGSNGSAPSECSSTHDLTVPVRGARANTSLPGIGVADGNVANATSRVDPARLHVYLNKMNLSLEHENHALRQEAEQLRKQFNKALLENERMGRKLEEHGERESVTSSETKHAPRQDQEEDAGAAAAQQELEEELDNAQAQIADLEQGHKELNDLLDEQEHAIAELKEIARKYEASKAVSSPGHASADASATERERALEQELHDVMVAQEAELELERERFAAQLSDAKAASDEVERDLEERLRQVESAWEAKLALVEKAAAKHADNADELKEQLKRSREERAALLRAKEATSKLSESQSAQREIARVQDQLARALDEARELRIALEERDEDYRVLEANVQSIEDECEAAKADLKSWQQAHAELDEQLAQNEEALAELEQEKKQFRSDMTDLQILVEEKQSELLKLSSQLRQAKQSPPPAAASPPAERQRVATLQADLAATQAEVRALEAKLASRSTDSSGAAALQAKEAEVEEVRQTLAQLEHKFEALKQSQAAVNSFVTELANESGYAPPKGTPLHRNVMALRAVATPASPPSMSAIQSSFADSTLHDGSMIERLHRLNQALDQQNANIDADLDDIDISAFKRKLTVQAEAVANEKAVAALKAQMAKLTAQTITREEVSVKVRCLKCPGCKKSFDARTHVLGESSASPAQASEASVSGSIRSNERQRALLAAQKQLEKVQEEWQRKCDELEEQNNELRDRADRAVSIKSHNKESAQRLHAATKSVIENARSAIAEEDEELRRERLRLRELMLISATSRTEGERASTQLRQAEQRLRSTEVELARRVKEHERLRNELMERSTLGESLPAQLHEIDAEVRAMAKDVEASRRQRNAIREEGAAMQTRIQEAEINYERAKAEARSSEEALLAHQAQIDEQVQQIEALHSKLHAKSGELAAVEDERQRMDAERRNVLSDISTLEKDLRRVRDEADGFGADLEQLRREREVEKRELAQHVDGSVAMQSAASRRIHALEQKLELTMRRYAQERSQTELATRAQHAAECKGLMLQIRYVKAKFMRESDLRADLAYQKAYLLQIVGGLQLNEEATCRFIADLELSRGVLPNQESKSPKLMFRKAVYAVMAVARMSRMSHNWQETLKVKEVLRAAHHNVRARRSARTEHEARKLAA